MTTNKPSAPSAPQFREFFANFYPEHWPHWHMYDNEKEADENLNGHKFSRFKLVETSALDSLRAELHRVQGIAADQQMVARDNFNDCLVMREENQKLSAELATLRADLTNEWKEDCAHVHKVDQEEIARLEAELDRVHNLGMWNHNAGVDRNRKLSDENTHLRKLLSEAAVALQSGRSYFTAVDAPSQIVTLGTCEVMRKEFVEDCDKVMTKLTAALGGSDAK